MVPICSANRQRGSTSLHGLLKDVPALYGHNAPQDHSIYASVLVILPAGEVLTVHNVQSRCQRS